MALAEAGREDMGAARLPGRLARLRGRLAAAPPAAGPAIGSGDLLLMQPAVLASPARVPAPTTGWAELADRLRTVSAALPLADLRGGSGAPLEAGVSDLLDACRIAAGEAQVRREPTDLEAVLDAVCASLCEEAAARGLDLAAYVDPALPRRLASDPARLRQVLSALASAALRATSTGGVLLEAEPDGRSAVRISVRDTDTSVREDGVETLPALPTGSHPGGFARTGEGVLGFCASVVGRLGGRLERTRRAGRGSTYAFSLTADALEPAAAWPTAAEGAAAAQVICAGPASRRAVARYLARAGYLPAEAGRPAVLVFGDDAGLEGVPPDPKASCIRLTTRSDGAARPPGGETRLAWPLRRDALRACLERVGAAEPSPAGGATVHDGLYGGEALLDAEVAAQLGAVGSTGPSAHLAVRYKAQADAGLHALLGAVETHDAAAASRAAAALKSASYAVGARVVGRMAADMEGCAVDGRPPAAPAVEELARVVGRTVRALAHGSTLEAPSPGAALPPEEADLLRDLRTALLGDQLSLAYQLQVDQNGERVEGVEALLRWTHPTLGPVSPARFIPLAEKAGLIGRITTWVVDRLLAETRYLTGLKVAFNASALEFSEPGFVDRLHGLIQHHGYDPRRLVVEITETVILENEVRVRQNIDRLRALGMKVALDDFGAGYSSLGHLRRYPFDKLKIDREFITDCSRDMQSATVVHAVVSIGRALGMKVIAEGVETETQRRFLKVAGVSAMQGFLFGEPVGVDELSALLARPFSFAGAA